MKKKTQKNLKKFINPNKVILEVIKAEKEKNSRIQAIQIYILKKEVKAIIKKKKKQKLKNRKKNLKRI